MLLDTKENFAVFFSLFPEVNYLRLWGGSHPYPAAEDAVAARQFEIGVGTLKDLGRLPKVGYLSLIDCLALECLPKLPDGLHTLNIRSCPKLMMLPDLPATLAVLRVDGCSSLARLPALPRQLRKLSISYCDRLEITVEMPGTIEEVAISYCPRAVVVKRPSQLPG